FINRAVRGNRRARRSRSREGDSVTLVVDHASANRLDRSANAGSPLPTPPSIGDLEQAFVMIHEASRTRIEPARSADAIARTISLWCDRQYPRRVDTIARIAHRAGFSIPLMDASIDALLRPFTRQALALLADR